MIKYNILIIYYVIYKSESTILITKKKNEISLWDITVEKNYEFNASVNHSAIYDIFDAKNENSTSQNVHPHISFQVWKLSKMYERNSFRLICFLLSKLNIYINTRLLDDIQILFSPRIYNIWNMIKCADTLVRYPQHSIDYIFLFA